MTNNAINKQVFYLQCDILTFFIVVVDLDPAMHLEAASEDEALF